MKRNIFYGIMLIGALVLGSCSATKLASNQIKDDDVYFSKAKAGDAPVYIANNQNNNVSVQDRYNNYNDDDYYYYDSYSSRINRFGYFSPFGFYDDYYYGYSPYSAYGYSPYSYGSGFNLGFGFGNYYGYSPYGYSPYYGYGYSPYNYFGIGYGYGFWGVYSAGAYGGYGGLAGNTPRPYRGSGAPTNAMVNRTTNAIGYNGNYPVNNAYPGRPASVNNGRQAVNSTGYNNNSNNGRPTRDNAPQVYTPQPQIQSAPAASSMGGGSSGSSGAASGGGGARPVRP